MFHSNTSDDTIYLKRSDSDNSLSSYQTNPFELEGSHWPTVEHYYQAMKFTDTELAEQIRNSVDSAAAVKLADSHKRKIRKDWDKLKRTIMTRGLYVMFRSHPAAAKALLATNNAKLVEQSQYDYYWGCGRDLRGDNNYGLVLMEIRNKLHELG